MVNNNDSINDGLAFEEWILIKDAEIELSGDQGIKYRPKFLDKDC